MKRKMKCPYCRHIFEITEKQQYNNYVFKCPSCKRYNYGSMDTDNNGVLIGVTKEQVKAYEEGFNANYKRGEL